MANTLLLVSDIDNGFNVDAIYFVLSFS